MFEKPNFFESGFPDDDLVRTISPRSTSCESESWGALKPTTVLLSSDHEKVTGLCRFCSSIPAEFWIHEPEHGEGVGIDLQTWEETCAEARNGCCFCRAIIGNWLERLQDFVDARFLARVGQGRGKMVKYRNAEFETRHTITRKFGSKQLGIMNLYISPSSWRSRSRHVAQKGDLSLMRDWLENCRLNHSRCNSIATGFLPTRLLDLEAFNGPSTDLKDDIKLVHSASFHSCLYDTTSVPRYITLSHCWGPPGKRPVVTYHDNLAARMERISFSDLPRTFQDTVVLTRKLGQRYLWIDSLCIIQDDAEDWANEASKMAKVYEQSYFTIAALSSADSSEGLQVYGDETSKRGSDEDMTFDLGVNDGKGGLFTVRIFTEEQSSWDQHYYCDLLSRRAWVLQEKELSTRSIHFGFACLLWECRELKGSSTLPWCNDLAWDADTDAERTWLENQPEDFAVYYTMKFRWFRISSEYSGRFLTHVTDTLPALSGIAQSFQKYFPEDKYIAGIWSSHLPLALLWEQGHRRNVINQRTKEYIAPSWSWTSSPCQIYYPLRQFHDIFQRMACKKPDRFRENLEVTDIKGEPKHNDPYGALKEGASLELGGALLFELDPDLERFADISEHNRGFYPIRKNGVEVGTFHQDAHVSSPFQDKLVCLGVCTDMERSGKETVSGLILKEHIRDGSPAYSRVGTFFPLSPSLWDDSEPRHITLI
ncbi:heterokaryon incompatibility protein-domain-containing protein [Sordaria brevicollis]|uniref:Heterokaryon incompatibility protein-domain-containing protein n=1 Tax=Sordaria brevicollis TaxID=83679 RepID=A0AAE0U663_SORBR|nr:heterokaryon incompatibility protein-domain-containing protein [Sordaria brevicollis]